MQVIINSQHYCDFPQRIHYDDITHLVIDGDVIISKIAYETASKPIKPKRGSIPANTPPIGFEPISYSPTGCDFDGFGNTDSGVKRRRSYEAAIYTTQGGYVGAPYAASTPTLTDSPRASPNISPYPTNGDAGTPYSVNIPDDTNAQSTVPLNREPSDLRPVSSFYWQNFAFAHCLFV